MTEMENQAEFYYEKLKESTNVGRDLLEFFTIMTGKDFGIIMMNKLVKIFGRFTVYFAIMDLSKYQSDQLNGNLYPLLYAICKGRFERIHSNAFSAQYESLNKLVKELGKEREKARKSKGKVPTSEGL